MFKWLRDFRFRRLMKKLRKEMLFWGVDLSQRTDEEIEKSIGETAKVICAAGITVAEFGDRLKYDQHLNN